MLKYFLSTVEIRATMAAPTVAGDTNKENILKDIRDGLSNFYKTYDTKSIGFRDAAWNEAYRLERLLALIEPASNLHNEIQRRLDEAAEEKVQTVIRLRANYETLIAQAIDSSNSPPALRQGGEPLLRSILMDIL